MVSIRGAHQQHEEHYSLAQFDVELWAKHELLLTNQESYQN